MPVREIEFGRAAKVVPCDTRGPKCARDFVCATLSDWNLESFAYVAELLVSELATNSAMHTNCDQATVEIDLGDEALRIAITDAGAMFAPKRPRLPGEPGGSGLAMVDAAALRWGIDGALTGKTVWFELQT